MEQRKIFVNNSGSNPDNRSKDGKYAEKNSCKKGNYGTDSFTRKKRAIRRADKQALKTYS